MDINTNTSSFYAHLTPQPYSSPDSNTFLNADDVAGRINGKFSPTTTHFKDYELPAMTNFPAAFNVFSIPSDLKATLKSLKESFLLKDIEGGQDAAFRLVGIPANIISTIGILLKYAIVLSILPPALAVALPATYIAGVVLCLIEAFVEFSSFLRIHSFRKKLDFKLLSHLSKLIENPNHPKRDKLIKQITSELKKHEDIALPSSFSEYELEKIACKILEKNLLVLTKEFLSPDFEKGLSKEGQENSFKIKARALSRRTHKSAAFEAYILNPIILENLENPSKSGLKTGLNLIKKIEIQAKKKQIIHFIGAVALLLAAASFITLLVGCPLLIPSILIVAATIFSQIRYFGYKGTMKQEGWHFSSKDCIPICIKKRIFAPSTKQTEIEFLQATRLKLHLA